MKVELQLPVNVKQLYTSQLLRGNERQSADIVGTQLVGTLDQL